jgi:hypothetical protein
MSEFRSYRRRSRHPRKGLLKKVRRHFDRGTLRRVCEMPESAFADAYQMDTVRVLATRWNIGEDYYYFKDNGSDILAVAHLDTVVAHEKRKTTFADTEAGPVVHSGALDDRLGAYTILELLPAMGIKFDWLLTVGEESGQSTAEDFYTDKQYNWVIEFDRGGTDVVTYQYEDTLTTAMVEAAGSEVGLGAFSDISYLEHLGVKCFNWGIGYRDYHSTRGYAFLEDTFAMVARFLAFHEKFADHYLGHTPDLRGFGRGSSRSGGLWGWDSKDYDAWWEKKEADLAADEAAANAQADAEADALDTPDGESVIDNPTNAQINAMLARRWPPEDGAVGAVG